MAKRDSFLLRIDPKILEAIRKWSDDDLRSMNAQIEYLLTKALKDANRYHHQHAKPSAPEDKRSDV
jgi:hypothetical protein